MDIVIYSKDNCVYCTRAKNLLKSLGYEYRECIIGTHLTRERFFVEFPNARTVPQIVIDGKNIGGYEDLEKMKDELARLKEETSGGFGEQEL